MTPEEVQKQLEALAKSSEFLRDIIERTRDAYKGSLGEQGANQKALEVVTASLGGFGKKIKKSSDDIQDSISSLKESYKNNELTADELSSELDSLRRVIAKTTDPIQKNALIQAKSSLESANALNKVRDNLKETFGNTLGIAVTGFAKMMTGAAVKALGGSDAMDVAAGYMTSQIDTVNSAYQAGASGLTNMGTQMAGAGGKVGLLGVAATAVGTAMGALSSQVSELAKAGIGFMMQSARGFMRDFDAMSQAGAIYTGGMDAMIDTAAAGGMTLEQFSKAVTNSKDALSSLGMGVGEASKRLSGAMNAGGKTARDSMFALGMSMEDQSEIYTTVMQRMAGPNQRLTASNAEVAEAAQAYARDLKTLQEITGEDVKGKRDKIRQENDTLAFQIKLSQMDPTKRANLEAAMEDMTESQRKALRENMIYGTVISKDIAIAQASNAGIRDTNKQIADAAKDGSLNAEKTRNIQKSNRAATEKDAKNSISIAMGTGEAAKDASKVILENWQYQEKFTKEAVAAAEGAIKSQTDAGASGTDTATNLKELNQKFATDMQQLAKDNLASFATALTTTFNDIQKSVKALASGGVKAADLIDKNMLLLIAAQTVPAILAWAAKSLFGKKSAKEVAGGVAGAAESAIESKAAGKAGKALEGLERSSKGLTKSSGGVISGFLKGLGSGLKELGNPRNLLGIAALVGIGASMVVASAAFKQFSDISWEGVTKGLAAIAGVGALGALAGLVGPAIAIGAGALGLLGVSIAVLGEALKGFPTGGIDIIMTGFKKLGDIVAPVFKNIGKVIGDVVGSISKTFEPVIKVFSDLWDSSKQIFSGLWDTISAPFKGLPKIISGMLESTKQTFGELWSFTKETFSGLWDTISAPFTGFPKLVSDSIDSALSYVGGLWTSIKETFSGIMDTISITWINMPLIVDDAITSVKNYLGGLWTSIQEIFSGIYDAISHPFDTLSTLASTVFDSVKSGAKAVGDFFGEVFSIVGSVISGVFNTIKDAISGAWDFIKNIGEQIKNLFGDVAAGAKKIFGFLTGSKEADQPTTTAGKDNKESSSEATKLFSEAVNKFSIAVDKMVANNPFASMTANPATGGDFARVDKQQITKQDIQDLIAAIQKTSAQPAAGTKNADILDTMRSGPLATDAADATSAMNKMMLEHLQKQSAAQEEMVYHLKAHKDISKKMLDASW
jgi:hypothetical protein